VLTISNSKLYRTSKRPRAAQPNVKGRYQPTSVDKAE
jgi:hypothetical protein